MIGKTSFSLLNLYTINFLAPKNIMIIIMNSLYECAYAICICWYKISVLLKKKNMLSILLQFSLGLDNFCDENQKIKWKYHAKFQRFYHMYKCNTVCYTSQYFRPPNISRDYFFSYSLHDNETGSFEYRFCIIVCFFSRTTPITLY